MIYFTTFILALLLSHIACAAPTCNDVFSPDDAIMYADAQQGQHTLQEPPDIKPPKHPKPPHHPPKPPKPPHKTTKHHPEPPHKTTKHHPEPPHKTTKHHPEPPHKTTKHHPEPPHKTTKHHPEPPHKTTKHHPEPPHKTTKHHPEPTTSPHKTTKGEPTKSPHKTTKGKPILLPESTPFPKPKPPPAVLYDVTWAAKYGNKNGSTKSVTCSKLAPRYPHFGKFPHFAYIGGAWNVTNSSSQACGACVNLTDPNTRKTIFIIAIDKAKTTKPGWYNISEESFKALNGGHPGTVLRATAKEVPHHFCGFK